MLTFKKIHNLFKNIASAYIQNMGFAFGDVFRYNEPNEDTKEYPRLFLEHPFTISPAGEISRNWKIQFYLMDRFVNDSDSHLNQMNIVSKCEGIASAILGALIIHGANYFIVKNYNILTIDKAFADGVSGVRVELTLFENFESYLCEGVFDLTKFTDNMFSDC